jgi:hypothetical protein
VYPYYYNTFGRKEINGFLIVGLAKARLGFKSSDSSGLFLTFELIVAVGIAGTA